LDLRQGSESRLLRLGNKLAVAQSLLPADSCSSFRLPLQMYFPQRHTSYRAACRQAGLLYGLSLARSDPRSSHPPPPSTTPRPARHRPESALPPSLPRLPRRLHPRLDSILQPHPVNASLCSGHPPMCAPDGRRDRGRHRVQADVQPGVRYGRGEARGLQPVPQEQCCQAAQSSRGSGWDLHQGALSKLSEDSTSKVQVD
jgi:hypothetical protein